MVLPETLRRQPRWVVLIEAVILVGVIGWVQSASIAGLHTYLQNSTNSALEVFNFPW